MKHRFEMRKDGITYSTSTYRIDILKAMANNGYHLYVDGKKVSIKDYPKYATDGGKANDS